MYTFSFVSCWVHHIRPVTAVLSVTCVTWRVNAVGVIDSSGLKFHYTKTLRPHDAGIMELGLEYTDKMALPPGLPLWKLVGYCIPECTRVVSDYAPPPPALCVTLCVLSFRMSVPVCYTTIVYSGLYCSLEIRKSKQSHRMIRFVLCCDVLGSNLVLVIESVRVFLGVCMCVFILVKDRKLPITPLITTRPTQPYNRPGSLNDYQKGKGRHGSFR